MTALTSSVAGSAWGERSVEVTDPDATGNTVGTARPAPAENEQRSFRPWDRRPAGRGPPRSVAISTVAPVLVGQDRSMHRACD
jgi:hypothetical protein